VKIKNILEPLTGHFLSLLGKGDYLPHRVAVGMIVLSIVVSGFTIRLFGNAVQIQTDSLHSLGVRLIQVAKYDSAQVVLQAEVKMREQLFDSLGLVNSLNLLSEVLCQQGKDSEGLESAERALAIITVIIGKDDTLAASSFNNIGLAYWKLGNYEKALENYNRVLSIRLTALGSKHPALATTYNQIGNVFWSLGNYEKALENYNKALSIRLKAWGFNHLTVASTYNNIGNVYADLGDCKKALENYDKSLSIRLKLMGMTHQDVAQSYDNIGLVYDGLGDYKTALGNFNQALSIRIKILGPENRSMAVCYNNIGNVYSHIGDYRHALENHNKALSIWSRVLGPEHPEVAAGYCDIGLVYWHSGDYAQALDNFTHALTIWLKTLGPEHPNVAKSYNNIGIVYYELGDYEKALENYQKALAIRIKVFGSEHTDIAISYSNIGNVHLAQGEPEKALESFNKSLAIKLKTLGPEHPSVAISNLNIGSAYCNLGEYQKALEQFNKALSIQLNALGAGHPDVGQSYNLIGTAYYHLSNYERSSENYKKSLAILLKPLGPGHPQVAEVYYNYGRTLRAQKKLRSALDFLKKSIVITEKIRAVVKSEELQKTYTEKVRNRYDEIVTLLLEMGRPKEAFEYYERSKSKLLQDELQKKGIEIGTGELKKKIGTVQSLSKQIGVLEKQVIDEKSKPAGEQNKGKIENLTRLLAQTKGEFYKLATEIKQNPDYAFTVAVDPIQLASIQKDLPVGNKLVMYYSSNDKLYILVVSNEGYSAKSVEVSKDSLASLVKVFRAVIDSTQLPPDQYSAGRDSLLKTTETALYNYLILPIEHEVAAATEITFIPSGNLYYIPLGALAYEKDKRLHYLIEDKSISYLTSAELLRYVERKAKKPIGRYDFLLVGNPTGADLPSTENEVKAIHALYPKSGLYLGGDAKETTIKKEASVYQILHLATHAFPNPQNPWDSYVYLVKAGEDDGRWTMAEVTNETWDKMALVTLSACETAIGGDKPGLEMESLARAFSIAGSPSIVASLWPVNDRSTQELMVNFYKNLKTMSKVEALRQAQLALMKNHNYAHPFYWAPFILIGDWR
jgi:CHAT domain-containing protein/lipoprotein NlpI